MASTREIAVFSGNGVDASAVLLMMTWVDSSTESCNEAIKFSTGMVPTFVSFVISALVTSLMGMSPAAAAFRVESTLSLM